MKKILAFILMAAMLLATTTFAVGAAELYSLTENFDSYTAGDLIQGVNTAIANGKWTSGNTMGAGLYGDDACRFGITADPDGTAGDNVLAIEGNSAWHAFENSALVKSTDVKMASDKAYKITTKIRMSDIVVSSGIKFMIHNNEQNWYGLFISGINATGWGTDMAKKFYFRKCVNGVMTDMKVFDGGYPGMSGGAWNNAYITYDNGKITIKVISAGGSSLTDFTVTDESPFITNEGELGFTALGAADTYVYYDDVTVNELANTISYTTDGAAYTAVKDILYLDLTKTTKLQANFAGVVPETVTWSSTDEEIVKIAADGTVIPGALGVATVTATYGDNAVSIDVSTAKNTTVLEENFNSYETTDLMQGTQQTFADGNWKSGISMGERYADIPDNESHFGIVANPDGSANNNSLAIEANSEWYTYNNAPMVKSTKLKMDSSKSYDITFNARDNDVVVGVGAKFMMHNNEQNFYGIFLNGVNATGWGTDMAEGYYLRKFVNGIVAKELYIGPKGFAYFNGNQWNTFNIKYDNGKIDVKITNGSGSVVADFSAIDDEPFNITDGELGFTAMGAPDYYGYFDNIKVKEYDNAVYYAKDGGAMTQASGKIYVDFDSETKLFAGVGGAVAKDAVWTSLNEDIVKVDADGKVVITGFGDATVSATSSAGSVSVVVSTVPKALDYSENFNTYDIATYQGTENLIADGNWKSGVGMGERYADIPDNLAYYGIVANPDGSANDNCLAIEANSEWYTFNNVPMVKSTRVKLDSSKSYDITFNARDNDVIAGVGAKFMMHNNEQNFYGIFLNGVNATGWGTDMAEGYYLRKYVNGNIAKELYIGPKGFAGFGVNKWNTFNIKYDNGKIDIKVVGTTGSEYVNISVVDDEPFDVENGEIGFTAMGAQGYYGYFDNFKVKEIGSEGEADNVLYADIIRNKPVIAADGENADAAVDGNASTTYTGKILVADAGEEMQIRGVVLDGLVASAPVKVTMSKDNVNWVNLAGTDVAGKTINTKAYSDFRYIKFESAENFTANDIKVISDAKTFKTRVNSSLYFIPRIGGVDTAGATYTFGESGFGTFDGDKFVATNTTKSVAVTANNVVSANIEINSGLSVIEKANGKVVIEAGCNYLTPDAKYIVAFYGEDGNLICAQTDYATNCKNTNSDLVTLTFDAPQAYSSAKLLCWEYGADVVKPITASTEL